MYASVRLETWEEVVELARHMSAWIFRGQASAQWALSTSLERSASRGGMQPAFRRDRERWVLRQFQRRSHLLIQPYPGDDATLEWVALLQHHGGPTRLLDFTKSFYVAAFFAMETATEDAAIWCVDRRHLDQVNGRSQATENIDDANRKYAARVETILNGGPSTAGIVHVEPDRLNERMAIQKGIFLFPLDITMSFMANLSATVGVNVEKEHLNPQFNLSYVDFLGRLAAPTCPRVAKFVVPSRIHVQAIHDLAAMNVDATTLFPGLDGFARSLHRYLRMP